MNRLFLCLATLLLTCSGVPLATAGDEVEYSTSKHWRVNPGTGIRYQPYQPQRWDPQADPIQADQRHRPPRHHRRGYPPVGYNVIFVNRQETYIDASLPSSIPEGLEQSRYDANLFKDAGGNCFRLEYDRFGYRYLRPTANWRCR